MSLVSVAAARSESDLSIILCLLEAHAIPAYVHNGGFGGLYPGPPIALYNARHVMVPSACREEALAALAARAPHGVATPPARDLLRIVLETLLFGWFVPGSRRRRKCGGSDR